MNYGPGNRPYTDSAAGLRPPVGNSSPIFSGQGIDRGGMSNRASWGGGASGGVANPELTKLRSDLDNLVADVQKLRDYVAQCATSQYVSAMREEISQIHGVILPKVNEQFAGVQRWAEEQIVAIKGKTNSLDESYNDDIPALLQRVNDLETGLASSNRETQQIDARVTLLSNDSQSLSLEQDELQRQLDAHTEQFATYSRSIQSENQMLKARVEHLEAARQALEIRVSELRVGANNELVEALHNVLRAEEQRDSSEHTVVRDLSLERLVALQKSLRATILQGPFVSGLMDSSKKRLAALDDEVEKRRGAAVFVEDVAVSLRNRLLELSSTNSRDIVLQTMPDIFYELYEYARSRKNQKVLEALKEPYFKPFALVGLRLSDPQPGTVLEKGLHVAVGSEVAGPGRAELRGKIVACRRPGMYWVGFDEERAENPVPVRAAEVAIYV